MGHYEYRDDLVAKNMKNKLSASVSFAHYYSIATQEQLKNLLGMHNSTIGAEGAIPAKMQQSIFGAMTSCDSLLHALKQAQSKIGSIQILQKEVWAED